MKLTGNLKAKVERTGTREEAKKAIADAGMLLNDDELDQVSGGHGRIKPFQGPAWGPTQNNSNDGGEQSGGCGEFNMYFGVPQCDCSGQKVDMIVTGTDDSCGYITYYQCPLCGAEKNVYEG